MASLLVTSGPRAGQMVEVADELVIGREHAELTIDDPEISRRHAVVRRVGGALEVEDLGSSNGTFVNGERIRGTVRVGGGAQIRLGGTVLEVQGVLAPETTRLHQVADPQLTRARDVPRVSDPQLTRARDVPQVVEPQVTRARDVPSASPQARPVQSPAAEPVTQFRPPSHRRSRRVASRSWLPVVLSYGTVVLTVAALIAYFASR